MSSYKFRPFQSPWWVVFAACLGLSVSSMMILQFALSVLIKPISAEFGWGRATVSTAFTFAALLLAIGSPIVGRLIDKWGVRPITLAAIILSSVATALMSLAPGNASIFIAMSAGLGFCGAGQAPLAYAKAIAGAFDRRRGLALGIGMAGVGVGSALIPRITQALQDSYGWRGSFVGLGALIFAVAFPAVALFLREPTGRLSIPVATHNGTGERAAVGLSAHEVVRTGSFWLLIAIFFFVPMACNGTVVHLVSMLTDRGIAADIAVKIFGGVGLSIFVGRLFCGALLDSFFAPYVAMFFIALPALGALLLSLNMSDSAQVAGAVLVGVGMGAEIDLIAYLQSRYFGMRAFGQVYGYLFMSFCVGGGLGPYAMGLSFDRAASYKPALLGFVAVLMLAIGMLGRLPKRFPYPAHA